MSNSYKYEDPNFTYIDPKTGILKNLAGLTNQEDLMFYESVAVTKRLQELYKNPIEIVGVNSLFEIHKHLFQDVYDWAGEKRKVEISKSGKPFFPTTLFDYAFSFIDNLILEFKKIPQNNKQQIAEKLAEILDAVNYLHPFREGNGRAQREFLRLLALQKKLTLNLNPPDDRRIYEQYMHGTINSDIKVLTKLILELIETKKDQ